MTVEHALSNIGKKIQIAHEVECIAAIVDLVRQGHGFGVLSLNAIKSSPWAAHSAHQAHLESDIDVSAVDRHLHEAPEERVHAQGDFTDRQGGAR